jgi:hypothetical protein
LKFVTVSLIESAAHVIYKKCGKHLELLFTLHFNNLSERKSFGVVGAKY